MPIIRSSRLYWCYCCIWCVMPWLLAVGGQVQGSRLCVRDEGSCSSSFPHPCCPAPDHRPPATKASHTICGNNTSTVSSSWWWAYKCPKHVEQIISAINRSVASSWFSSWHYTTTHGQTYIKLVNIFIRLNALDVRDSSVISWTTEEAEMDSQQPHEAEHSPSFSAEIKNKWSLPPLSHAFSQSSVLIKYRWQFWVWQI